MPSLGADMEDGTFVRWYVEPGQAVKRGDVVCVVDTQKGAIDVEIWETGTIAKLVAEQGQRIPVGQTMAVLAGPEEDWKEVAAAAPAPVAAKVVAPTPVAAAAAGFAPSFAPPGEPLRISPAARRRAAELGVDVVRLAAARGGSPVSLVDVEAAAAQPTLKAEPQRAAPERMRAAIAAAMARSKREIPHYYLGCEIDVERATRWLEEFNAARPLGERVLFAALALKAVALALREVPDLNGHLIDGAFRRADAIHIGVVTSLRGGGVIVPTVHDADRLALPDLMAALRDVLMRAREGQLRSSDLADATITVSNLGDLGVETVYGVIYPPQVALVGLGRVSARPLVREGAIVAARAINITLSADHRVTDGMMGARFLAGLRERLQEPESP
ncbi:MAG TPA: dihydrolipoamide acetyltransferase family protein [Burkholderiaceae bacterium]|nr:dihydrolipoamide acetyltransferase family protein [Burkholderiaceae bacterium]